MCNEIVRFSIQKIINRVTNEDLNGTNQKPKIQEQEVQLREGGGWKFSLLFIPTNDIDILACS